MSTHNWKISKGFNEKDFKKLLTFLSLKTTINNSIHFECTTCGAKTLVSLTQRDSSKAIICNNADSGWDIEPIEIEETCKEYVVKSVIT